MDPEYCSVKRCRKKSTICLDGEWLCDEHYEEKLEEKLKEKLTPILEDENTAEQVAKIAVKSIEEEKKQKGGQMQLQG